jgi:hypothetical protein
MKSSFLIVAITAILFAGTALADEHEYEYEHKERRENSSAKFYGVIDALPQHGITGNWLVNGRQVVVNQNTAVKEKRGKVAVGAYVKVEGYPSGASFTADEIEVKGSRR